MNRRAFLAGVTGAVVLRPPASAAQQAKVPTVAILLAGSFPESQSRMFAQALRDLGYVEGQNIRIDIRSAENDAARLSELAAALVHEKVDVIVPFPTNAALAAKRATAEIPIVLLAVGHAVGMGIVASYARPGGNITGTTALFPELAAKHVELLKELSPNLRRIAALGNTSDAAFAKVFIDHVQRAGNAQQVDIVPVMVAAGTELDAAFPAMASNKVEAVIVQGSLVDEHVAEISIAHRLPVVSPFLAFPRMGALMAYNGVPEDNIRGAASFVDKILKGAKPADLPIQQPMRFRLIINLKTAKALGLAVPQSLLAPADEVIE